MHRRIPYQRAIQKNAASPTLSLDANDMKATSRNNARSPFLPRQALSNESVPMGGALVRLMQMAGPNEQALTIRKSPPTLFVLSSPWEPFLPPLAHSARLPLCPLTQALCLNPSPASYPTYFCNLHNSRREKAQPRDSLYVQDFLDFSSLKRKTDKFANFSQPEVCVCMYDCMWVLQELGK